ncbi:MAG: glycosyltransferase family 39 protein [Rickettsiales bacterium]
MPRAPFFVRYDFFIASALIAALTLWRVFYLFHSGRELFFDEAQYAYWAAHLDFGYYSKPPVVAWAIAASQYFCGQGESCARLPAPLFHAGAALFVFAAARTAFGRSGGVALPSSLAYATLPGVFLSSSLISTDAPLLFFWAGALFFFVRAVMAPHRLADWIGCGLCSGLGLESKYSMAFFAVGALGYVVATPYRRYILAKTGVWTGGAITFLLLLPNVMWNAQNGFVSFLHTGDNASGEGYGFHPEAFAEFFGGQFAVFGPIFFPVLLVALCCRPREGRPNEPNDALLAWQVVPALAMMGTLAFFSRAHANWAAPAYVAGSIYVARYLCATRRAWLIYAGIALHVALAAIAFYPGKTAEALNISLAAHTDLGRRTVKDPYMRLVGGRDLGEKIDEYVRLARHKPVALLTDDRATHALLAYYSALPDERILRLPGRRVADHFQLTASFDAARATPGEYWIVSRRYDRARFAETFGKASLWRRFDVGPYEGGRKRYYLYRVRVASSGEKP